MTDKKTLTISIKPFGVPSLLTVLFVYLKLTAQIDWSWLWVLAPTWIPLALGLTIMGCFLGFAAVCFVLAAVFNK